MQNLKKRYLKIQSVHNIKKHYIAPPRYNTPILRICQGFRRLENAVKFMLKLTKKV